MSWPFNLEAFVCLRLNSELKDLLRGFISWNSKVHDSAGVDRGEGDNAEGQPAAVALDHQDL